MPSPRAVSTSPTDGDGEDGQDWAVFDVSSQRKQQGGSPFTPKEHFSVHLATHFRAVFTSQGMEWMARRQILALRPRAMPITRPSRPTPAGGRGRAILAAAPTSAGNTRWTLNKGNSGSPIIAQGTDVTVGIHTNGGCSQSGGANIGTSFENDGLETALRNFSGVGANVSHLDIGHVLAHPIDDGTVFRPFDTLAEAVNSVPAGGVVSIVAGSYGGGITISKPMTLRAPVGPVTLSGAP